MNEPAPELDWDDVRFFLYAVRAGSLAGAARAMGVEHTTVGRRLSRLERHVGVPLVVRRADGLRLTAEGERILPVAEDMDRVARTLRASVHASPVRVRLAVPSGFATLFAARALWLRETHPTLSLEIVSGAVPADFEKGEVDVAVRGASVQDPNLVVRTLCDVGFSLYASPEYLRAHPYSPAERSLHGHRVIGFDASLTSTPSARFLTAHADESSIVLRSREMTDMLAAAERGVGIAILPCFMGDSSGSLARVTPEVCVSQTLSVVCHVGARRHPHIRAVLELVRMVASEHESGLRGALVPA